jgi:hypothetical protein
LICLTVIIKNMKAKFKILGIEITLVKVLAFILTGILLGILKEIGKDLYDFIKSIKTDDLKLLIDFVERLALYKIEINLFVALIVITLFIPIYRFIDKKILSRIISETIFYDDFSNDKYFWAFNYWGSANPHKTNRIQNNNMIFEANTNDWPTQNFENGALIDVREGIIKGLHYIVVCEVKSSINATMGFKLWLHDTKGDNSMTIPVDFETPPSNNYKEYSLPFKATDSNSIRIHLHCKAGEGYIMIDNVKIIRKK